MKPLIIVHQAFCMTHVNSACSLYICSSFVLVWTSCLLPNEISVFIFFFGPRCIFSGSLYFRSGHLYFQGPWPFSSATCSLLPAIIISIFFIPYQNFCTRKNILYSLFWCFQELLLALYCGCRWPHISIFIILFPASHSLVLLNYSGTHQSIFLSGWFALSLVNWYLTGSVFRSM